VSPATAGGQARGSRDDIVVRRVRPADAAAVSRILNAVIENGSFSLLDTPFSALEEREYIERFSDRGVFNVAEHRTEGVVAFQSLEPYASVKTTAFDHVLTMGTYVAERHRREGIGTRLAEVAFAEARQNRHERIITEIRVDNETSLRFHYGLGFAIVGVAHGAVRVGDRRVDLVIVEKSLLP
jgi:L-amino acid N-acyltransferase YncA